MKNLSIKLENANSFQDLFSREITVSEKLRTNILIIMLGLEAFLLIVIYSFYQVQYVALFNTKLAIFSIFIFTILIIVYELLVRAFLQNRIGINLSSRKLWAYINSFSEITLLSFLFIFIIEYSDQTFILKTPATLTYFVFIVLSTLRLDMRLSIFTGILATVEFLMISTFYSSTFSTLINDIDRMNSTGMEYWGQGTLLLISTISAGFVADSIKKKTALSLEIMKEKNDVIDLFGQQVSPQIVQNILEHKKDLKGVRKNVCVMFLDIRNFTTYVEHHNPEEVVAYLNCLFDFMIDSVQRNNGVINQFLGDGFMATFGAPFSDGNISEKAVLASKEIIQELTEMNHSGKIPETRIGIGLHYGEAVIGNIGSSVRKQYSITGEVVIIASRIEQLCKSFPSQLLISQDVYKQINNGSKIDFQSQLPTEVKGIRDPVILFAYKKI